MAEPVRPGGHSSRFLWPVLALPGILWLALFFLVALYVVFAIVFGQTDPVFLTPIPVWNPLEWNSAQMQYVFQNIWGPGAIYGPAVLRTFVYVLIASVLSLLIAFPVSYYTARFAGRWKGVIILLLIAPFWISYMMRMLGWVNLLQTDGLVNQWLSFGGLFDVQVDWLNGKPVTVIFGLIYGYVPYMILPLFAGLDRIPTHMIEAARDLGAGRFGAFRRVTWPLSRPAVAAAILLTCLPMIGDFYTNDMLSANPSTSMVGNLINTAYYGGQPGQAGAFVLLILAVSLLPMIWYVRSTQDDGARS